MSQEDNMLSKKMIAKIEEISASRPGTLWYQPTGTESSYWLRVVEPEECLVDILTGKMLHASKFATQEAYSVCWNEVMF
jgi:hypothetical protein